MSNATESPLASVAAEPAAAQAECTATIAVSSLTLEELAGEDPQMLRNVRCAYRIADTDIPVLIQGPTGSGKEAFARAIHLISRRAEHAFVAVNCAAIPETLIESELFGYRPGAFTGARREGLRGRIAQSSGGTLFLDEIGDMPLGLQSRLLRVLEERQIVPLGSDTAVEVELHVMAASHRDLREMVARGSFREDLYYRLNGLTLEIPALCDRADKQRLIQLTLASETCAHGAVDIECEALERLLEYAWPGNVRELRNVVRTALAICDDGVIRHEDLPAQIAEEAMRAPLDDHAVQSLECLRVRPPRRNELLLAAERTALLRAIDISHGNMSRAAMRLGVSRNTLYRKMKRHGIEPDACRRADARRAGLRSFRRRVPLPVGEDLET